MSFGMSSSSAHADSIDMNIADNFDFQKRQHFDPPQKVPTSCKRKCNYDEVSLSEQIKRFRITSTPGELRLQKDLKELEASGLNGVSFHCADDSGTVIVQFADVIPFAPATFRISVPRYYPHNQPIVFCVSNGFPCPFILPTGEIVHPGLREEWSAIRTLRTVIDILQSIRLICHNSFQTEYVNAGLCCLNSDLNGLDDIKESNEIYMAEIMLPGEES